MSRTRWAAAAVLCLATAVTGCAPARNTLPVVTGAFGTDPLIGLPAGKPPGALVVRRLGQGPGPVVRPGDYFGKAGNPPEITGTDTLVFVVDILAATHG